jgi:hypothetical protein
MTVERRETMKKDSNSIFQNRETRQKRNQIHKTIIAHILKSEFKKEFKTCRILVGDQFFTVDLMSEDDEIAAKIVNPCSTCDDKISSGKFQCILSAILILRAIDSERKLLIFTNKTMYQNFYSSIRSMPGPICEITEEIEIAWVPLPDEFDNDEYSEPITNFRINEGSFNQIRRIRNDRN